MGFGVVALRRGSRLRLDLSYLTAAPALVRQVGVRIVVVGTAARASKPSPPISDFRVSWRFVRCMDFNGGSGCTPPRAQLRMALTLLISKHRHARHDALRGNCAKSSPHNSRVGRFRRWRTATPGRARTRNVSGWQAKVTCCVRRPRGCSWPPEWVPAPESLIVGQARRRFRHRRTDGDVDWPGFGHRPRRRSSRGCNPSRERPRLDDYPI
jgi:hypothetical protein